MSIYDDNKQTIQACLSCKLKDCRMYSEQCKIKQIRQELTQNGRKKAKDK